MKSKRNRLLHSDSDSDPMGTVANLFDVAMVFAVALMVALVSRFNMTEMFSKEDFTMVKNPGKENMEIITKEGQEIKKYTPSDSDSDPMGTVANLFDVAMVFAVALMVALVSRFNMTEMFSKEDFTMVKNPGKENMEIITKEGQEIKKYTPSEDPKTSGKRGKKVGVAYQLENGEIIYVPE